MDIKNENENCENKNGENENEKDENENEKENKELSEYSSVCDSEITDTRENWDSVKDENQYKDENQEKNDFLNEPLPDFTDKSVTEIFLYIIKKHTEENVDLEFSSETIDIINSVLDECPTLLDNIKNAITEVIKDNKIDTDDVPQFIEIYKSLYEKLDKLDSSKRAETCGTVLKFIVHSLVEERKIDIKEYKLTDFLVQVNILIDSCVSLLVFTNTTTTQLINDINLLNGLNDINNLNNLRKNACCNIC